MRRLAANLALAVGGVLVALAIAEVALRLSWEPEVVREEPAPPAGVPVLDSVFDLARPNVRGFHKGVMHETNQWGFRGPAYAARPPAGVFRIVVVGDSVTMGEGVAQAMAYPARLEGLLNAESPGGGDARHYEVLNLGLSGLSLEHVLGRLEQIGLGLAPDLLVYGFTTNDIEGPAYRDTAMGPLGKQWVQRFFRHATFPLYVLRIGWPYWMSLREQVAPEPGSHLYDVEQNYFHNPAAWGDFTRHLDRLRDIGAERQVCVHVLIHTDFYLLWVRSPFRAVYARVADAVRARNMTVTETHPLFEGRDAAEFRLSWFNRHPNETGHAVLAGALHEGLRQLPARCWER
jgi:lysophospholipase L1-like esterase